MNNVLYEYFIKYGSCKSNLIEHYGKIYEFWLSSTRSSIKRLLEIGIYNGGSIRAYADYFENAEILGVDIEDKKWNFDKKRISVMIGDQADDLFLDKICKLDKFDVIIDDGGHKMHQQIKSFERLFSMVSDGGFYVIEDLHTSYWPRWGGGLGVQGTTINYLKNHVDTINEKSFVKNRKAKQYSISRNYSEMNKQIESIHFYSDIVVIKKK